MKFDKKSDSWYSGCMNSIENSTHSDIDERRKRVKEIVTQIEKCIAKFKIIKNHNTHEFHGYIPNKNIQIDQKTKIALIAMIHDEQLYRIKQHPHMSLSVIFGAFICLYDGQKISWQDLNLEKIYQTKYIDINTDYKNPNSKTETMNIIYIDINPPFLLTQKISPIDWLKEEFKKYIKDTVIDILLENEWLKRKVTASVDDIIKNS